MPRYSISTAAIALALVSFLLTGAATAFAQDFELAVWTIRATKSNGDISPELRPIANELKQRYKFTGFKLEKQASANKKQGEAYSADLIGGYKIKVTPEARDGDRVKLQVELSKREGGKDKRLTSTSFTINKGRFQLIGVGKIDEKNDDELIVAVSGR